MNFTKLSKDEILINAIPIMDNLMEASTQLNYEKHIKHFTCRLKTMLCKEQFLDICKQYQQEKGYFSNRELIDVLIRADSAVIIWKQYFTKKEGEYLAQMVLVNENDKFLCDHALVF